MIIPLLFVFGCTTPEYNMKKPGEYPQKDGSVIIVDSPAEPKKSRAEIRQLTKEAEAGDGKAAFALASYYGIVEGNVKKSKEYHALAEKLKYPLELFGIALMEWADNPSPDLNKIEGYAKIAAQAGVDRADELLAEIAEARTSGVIPNRTKFRLIVPKS